jgi:probable rRNA maturation factor
MTVTIKNHQKLIRINLRKTKKDSLKLLASFNLDRAELGILFVGDRRMKDLNRIHRNINKTTDVLSFPLYRSMKEMPAASPCLLGDVVINPRAAQRQAVTYDVNVGGEIRRLLIHGFLHLLGYDHERSRYRAKRMRQMEKTLWDALETLD